MKNVAIVGFGEMGKRHGLDMESHSHGRIRVAGVVEPDDNKYKQGCEWMKASPRRYASVGQMLEELRPDGAVISAPNFLHLECLRPFSGKNIPLLVEKPLDSALEKIFGVVRFAAAHPAPVIVHHVMRYAPIVAKAKQLIERGELGKLCSFQFQQTIGGGMFHNFRRTMATGGGQLLEKATHDFDVLLHWAQSRPKRVSSVCKQQYYGGGRPDDLHCCDCPDAATCESAVRGDPKREFKDVKPSNDLCAFAKCVDIPDNELCVLELEDGVFGSYANTYFVNGFFSRVYQMIGTEALMRVCFSLPRAEKDGFDGKIEVYRNDGGYEKFEFDYEQRIHYNGSPAVTAHFLELLEGKQVKLHSPVDEAFAAELVALAAYESNRRGLPVEVADLLPADLKGLFANTFNTPR